MPTWSLSETHGCFPQEKSAWLSRPEFAVPRKSAWTIQTVFTAPFTFQTFLIKTLNDTIILQLN